MPQIIVYPSSKQFETDGKTICKERSIICKLVNRHQRNEIPIKCALPEQDTRGGKNFKKKILINLRESNIFIAAINTRYSEFIDYEINNVFDIIKDENLIHIRKKNMRDDEIEKEEINIQKRKSKRDKQLKLIAFVESRQQHLPYSSLKEFEAEIDKNLLKMIDRLYKQNGVKFPYSFE